MDSKIQNSEETSLLLTNTEPSDITQNVKSTVGRSTVKKKLYISHFLYVWNARIYEFAIILFIINLFPNDLMRPSLFSLFCTGSGIFLTSTLSRFVNHGERLSIIKSTILIQRSSAVLSSATLLVAFRFFKKNEAMKHVTLALVILAGCIETLSTIANKISISRDWIVKICHGDQKFLVELNTRLRSIDLFCKLVGPFFISTFLTLTNHEITAAFLILSFLICNHFEISAIMNIYHAVPALKDPESDRVVEPESNPENPVNKVTHDSPFTVLLKSFLKNPFSPFIIAVSMTYFTVLSFGGSTVAYLLSFDDITTFSIGVLKAVSTAFELFGTMVVFPFLTKRVGLINTGIIAVTLEFLSLVPVAIGFLLKYEYTRWLMCICIPFSRVGLWCFDLALQSSIQVYIIDDFERSNATSFEEMFNNLFSLLGFISTLIFHKPEQFEYPSLATVTVIGGGVLLIYIWYFKIRSQKIIIENH